MVGLGVLRWLGAPALAAAFALLWASSAAAAPPNDFIENAIPIQGMSGSVSGTNVGAGGGYCEGGLHGVWFKWTAPASGTLRLFVDSVVAHKVWARTDISWCYSGGYTGDGRSSEHAVTGGQPIWILVSAEEGAFRLDHRLIPAAKPANDDFADAEVLPGQAGTKRFTNAGASREAGEPLHAGNSGGRSLWFTWTASTSGRAVFATAPTEVDTVLAVYTGSDVASLTRVASNDDGGPAGASRVEFLARAGETYRIAVDGRNGVEGSIWRDYPRIEKAFSVVWNSGPPPSNDDFTDASVLVEQDDELPIPATGWTTGASNEPGEPSHSGSVGSASVWLRWTPTKNGGASVRLAQLEESLLTRTLRVYTGPGVARLTPVPGTYHPLAQPFATWQARAGTTYHIALDPGLDSTGPYILSLSQGDDGLPNDDFADALTLEGPVGAYSRADRGATAEPGEPYHAGWRPRASVWFAWTAPSSGPVTFDTYPKHSRALAVYEGTTLASLRDVAANSQGPLTFTAIAGTTYRLAIDDNEQIRDSGPLFWRMASTADTTPPTGHVTAPLLPTGADVSGLLTMVVDAADDTAIQRVVPHGYQGWTGWPDSRRPYTFTIDTTLFPDGQGIGLRASILDMAYNQTITEDHWVRNENFPPLARIDSPDGAVSSTTAQIYARADQRDTLTARLCSLDGRPYVICNDGFEFENLGEGDHVLRAHVVDHSDKRSVAPGTAVWTVDTRPVAVGPPGPDSTPPIVSAPYPRTVAAVQAGARAAPVRLSFEGSDAGGSIGHYEVEQRVGSGSWRRVWNGSASSVTRQLAPGTYRHRVRAVDRGGNVGPWAESPLRIRALQETALRFGGAWARARVASAHGGALRQSAAAGAWAQASFTGSSVALISAVGPARGKAEVWVDGVRMRTIDLYSARSQVRRVVFQHDFDRPGPHVVKVRVLSSKNPRSTGRHVDVDAFVVLD